MPEILFHVKSECEERQRGIGEFSFFFFFLRQRSTGMIVDLLLSLHESRTSCCRLRCCITRGGRRSFFRDFDYSGCFIDGNVTLTNVVIFLFDRERFWGLGSHAWCVVVCVDFAVY